MNPRRRRQIKALQKAREEAATMTPVVVEAPAETILEPETKEPEKEPEKVEEIQMVEEPVLAKKLPSKGKTVVKHTLGKKKKEAEE